MVPQSLPVVSKCTVFPDKNSILGQLKLSASDLPMLSCHYIQKGCVFTKPPFPVSEMIASLKCGLSQALARFPPLAGRLCTDSGGYVYVKCNDAGVDFVHADGRQFRVRDVLGLVDREDVPEVATGFFGFDRTVSFDGHFKPVLAVQVTELADGVFIGCAMNHSVADGTSFWNFFNSFAELSRGAKRISRTPDFSRDSVLISSAVLRIPAGGPKVTFDVDAPVRVRIFRFSVESILKLKFRVNNRKYESDAGINLSELMGKHSNDPLKFPDGKTKPLTWLRTIVSREANYEANYASQAAEISSFQSLSALLWRGITRARKLPASKMTTFRMAVNCRHRLEPKLEPLYFGNAIQSIPTYAPAGEVLSRDLRWCAEQLNRNVAAHGDATVRKNVEEWERDPRCFPLGNFDGAMITMGSSPRFPMYENNFGWGKPVAIRSGRANKFDGKISAFPGREGGRSVDLEVVLSPDTMAGLESDPEFMEFVSGY